MPVMINEIIAEIEPSPVPETQSEPIETRVTSDLAEFEILRRIALLEERRARLVVD